ncbi:phytanoyl-CoA dioxygenase family protein [Pseudodonghicola flavimaris]|uniref:Phytanoyl-CoA dioxygenase n=1 Tax=Pseudodonghicola flavimaris TaxID=3050036 RepID=A0ABT7F7E4_9RHOB|nr:hypothetical protein [Pseudodonghicola flavimaris]MDK3020533.1 hypothetical protein [Pseudodonghicola flavimaris]
MVGDFFTRGWARFGADPQVRLWAAAALTAGRAALRDPAFSQGHVCEGSWFVGLDALPNDAVGRVAGSAPLSGPAVAFLRDQFGTLPPLHRGQLSTVFPGYPRPRAGEGPGAFRYRQRRDAAHLDGLKAEGPDRRRRIAEPHAFILGLPLTDVSPQAAPLVVWEGSHEILRAALAAALAPYPPERWSEIDVTEAYQAARREVFETCRRLPLPARPGEAVLLHRLALHGVAPWSAEAPAPAEGRMIAYFRPPMPGGITAWLGAD